MRKIKAKERKKAGNIYCPFCKPKKIDAIWRKDNFTNYRFDVSCEEHKENLHEVDDSRITEADYQTWFR